jgi:hypothetical protein
MYLFLAFYGKYLCQDREVGNTGREADRHHPKEDEQKLIAKEIRLASKKNLLCFFTVAMLTNIDKSHRSMCGTHKLFHMTDSGAGALSHAHDFIRG